MVQWGKTKYTRGAMMHLEYESVRYNYDLLAAVDRRTFDERLTSFLNQRSAKGWELKGSFHDFGFHIHLIFAKPRQSEESGE